MNTLISVVLDKSGSMASTRDATISGFNEMLETHQRENPDAALSLLLFDTVPQPVRHFPAVKFADKLTPETYAPGGNTALHDAIGQQIRRIEALDEQPDRIAFVIITDGEENQSREYDLNTVRQLIEWHTNEGKGWAFTFLGANIDAYAVGGAMGVAAAATMTYHQTPLGTQAVFASVGRSTSGYTSGTTDSLDYDADTRKKVESTK